MLEENQDVLPARAWRVDDDFPVADTASSILCLMEANHGALSQPQDDLAMIARALIDAARSPRKRRS
jgi:hypothetical protein